MFLEGKDILKTTSCYLKGKINREKCEKANIEGTSNRLHYRATVMFLLGFSIVITLFEYIEKISCMLSKGSKLKPGVIETYCFIQATFSLPKYFNLSHGAGAAPYGGVGVFPAYANPKEHEVKYHAYYQWVPFVLFFQSILFYLPHLILKHWDGEKLVKITAGLNLPPDVCFPAIHTLILDKSTRSDKAKMLAKYFGMYKNTHNFWAIKLIVIDFLYFFNVLANIYFIDAFLGGEFRMYGFKVLEFLNDQPEDRVDPMAVVFPTVTKCTFYNYGKSGSVQNHDALCVLPLNIVNQRLYVFIWFWLIILCLITAISLSMHMFVIFYPVTYAKLHFRAWKKSTIVKWDQLERDLHLKFGDWKLLSIIARNMEPLFFEEFIHALVIKGHELRNGDIALKPLNRSFSSNLGSHQRLLQSRRQTGSQPIINQTTNSHLMTQA